MLLYLLLAAGHGASFVSVSDTAGLPQDNCSWGFSLGDYDADGDPDVYMHSHIQGLAEERGITVRSHLLRNDGDIHFTDVTEQVGMNNYNQDPHHASFCDIDDDGDLDVYVQMGTPKDFGRCYSELWEQQSDGGFVDIAEQAGTQGVGFRGRGATWADIDLDGDLDVYGPGPLASAEGHKVGLGSLLYLNEGEGRFSEVGEAAGVGRYDIGGYQAAFGDMDGDRLPDLAVTWPLEIYRNRGDGHFVEVTAEVGLPKGLRGRSSIWEDYDGDGDLDLFVTVDNIDPLPRDAEPGLRLYQNDGAGRFTDVTAAVGLSDSGVFARGATFGDIDNDGDLDLFVSELTRYRSDKLYIMGPDGRYEERAKSYGLAALHEAGRSDAAFADFDGDGRLDLLIAQGAGGCYNNHGAPEIYRNDLHAGHYLQVKLQGTRSSADALGAVVELSVGGETRSRHHLGPQHYLNQDRLPLHFGLGDHEEVEGLVVRWPSGLVEAFTVAEIDSRVHVVEGEGRPL